MQVLDFDSAVSSFLNHVQIERGLAINSVSAYRRDLAKFKLFVEGTQSIEGTQMEHIDSQLISNFQSFLRTQNMSISTLNRIQSTLRSFYKHLQIEYGLANPVLEMESIPTARRLPKALTVDQIIRLIDAAYRPSDPITIRDQAMLELLYSSGARVSELIGINVSDLSTVETEDTVVTTLKLRGKGSKERIVPLGSFATKSVQNYLVRIRPDLCSKNTKTTSALFLNSRGSRISRQSAWQIVLDSAMAAGITDHVSPHVFRHSYATHLLDGGADIRVVQELLGHASVTTTQIYTLITIDKIRESYSLAHPRAK